MKEEVLGQIPRGAIFLKGQLYGYRMKTVYRKPVEAIYS